MRVHGEVFAAPVDGDAEALHLLKDRSAIVLLPLPDALDKGLAAELLARCAFRGQLALDEHLRGDAGVVRSRHPQDLAPEHAPPTSKNVDLGVLQHVAHVEVAGDVWRRKQDHKGGLVARVAGGFMGRALVLIWSYGGFGRRLFEKLLADPVGGPVIFNGGWVVGFRQVVRHFVG